MGRMTATVDMTPDHQMVVLQFYEDGKALGHLLLTGAETEHLIGRLSDGRASLAESVPVTLDPGSRLPVTAAPEWAVRERPPGEASKVLALRHPGIGWLAFHLEKDRAEAIGRELS